MNLCDFCINHTKVCSVMPKFVRPIGQRVMCCTEFAQYPASYADITYTDFQYPNRYKIVGCSCSKPLTKERKKNQINYTL
jgi:hypothetical protein